MHGVGGRGKNDKESFLMDLLVHPWHLCICLHSKRGSEPQRTGVMRTLRRKGNYREGELMPRSQGHYLIIQVLSLFSPENKNLK